MPVEAWRQVQTPPPQQMERRPTFEGQAPNVGVLLVFVLLGGGVGAVAFYWVGVDKLTSLVLGLVFVVSMWLVYLTFTTGFLHKLIEQRTEQQRINASIIDAIAVNDAQDELFENIRERFAVHDARLSALETIKIIEQGKTREIPKQDALDIMLREWIAKEIFNSHGILTGTHPNGQLKYKMPFKEGTPGYDRLVWAQLVTKRGDNYHWVGPQTWADTIVRLEIKNGGQDD